jgi:hypothetical protein
MRFRIQSLKRFLDRYSDSPRFPTIPILHVRAAMKESATKVLDATEYVPYSFFDDFFSFFVYGRPDLNLGQFGARARSIAGQVKGKSLNFSAVTELIGVCVKLLKPKDQREVIVIKNGVYRLFFDRLFMHCPQLFEGTKPDAAEMGGRCSLVRWMTPHQMSIPDKLMQPSMVDMPFATLLRGSPQLQQAVREIEIIPFLTNPIDIMAHVFNSLKSAEDFVRQNSFQNRFGMFVSMFDKEKLSSVSDQLSFDDFFPMFCLVFSSACPSNAMAISDLMAKFTGLGLAPAFDFAKLFFTSAVQYMRDFNSQELDPAQMDDEYDPLGLKRH